MSDNAAGWQPDPTGKHDHRYWDGTQWTENVADARRGEHRPLRRTHRGGRRAGEAPADVPDRTARRSSPMRRPVSPPSSPPWRRSATPPRRGPPPTRAACSPALRAAGPGGRRRRWRRSSKRGLLIGGAILAVVAIAVIAFLALGGDDDDSDVRGQLASQLSEQADEAGADISDDDAECLADSIIDELGEDAFEGVDFNADEPPAEIEEALEPRRPGRDRGVRHRRARPSGVPTARTTAATIPPTATTRPWRTWPTQCEDGDFVACDDLYFSADFGSDHEEFGSTCGGTAEPQSGFCEATNGGEDDGRPPPTSTATSRRSSPTPTRRPSASAASRRSASPERIRERSRSGDIDEEQAMPRSSTTSRTATSPWRRSAPTSGLSLGYRPVHSGGRFSVKAAIPSAASSVDAVIVSRGCRSRRLASTSWSHTA